MAKALLIFVLCALTTEIAQSMIMGGSTDVDLSNPQTYKLVKNYADYAACHVTGLDSSRFNIKLVNAKQQIVAGIKYSIEATLSYNNCHSRCTIKTCKFFVVAQLWIKKQPIKLLDGNTCY